MPSQRWRWYGGRPKKLRNGEHGHTERSKRRSCDGSEKLTAENHRKILSKERGSGRKLSGVNVRNTVVRRWDGRTANAHGVLIEVGALLLIG